MTNSHGHVGTPMVISTAQNVFQNSVSIPSFKQRSVWLFPPNYFLKLNHSFQMFLPDFLPLNSFIPLSRSFLGNCIPVFSQEVVGPRFTWTSSNHVVLHISQRSGRCGGSSTRWHGLSFFLEPQKPLGTPS